MSRHFYILIRNSGVSKNQTSHLFRAMMNKYNTLSSEYNDELNGWVVAFQYKSQAEGCMNQFNGKTVLPGYPTMDISIVSFNK